LLRANLQANALPQAGVALFVRCIPSVTKLTPTAGPVPLLRESNVTICSFSFTH